MREADLKQIAVLAVFIIFFLPVLLGFLYWSVNPDRSLEDGANLIVQAEIPWWIGATEVISNGLPSGIAGFFILGLFFFLKWIGEIR